MPPKAASRSGRINRRGNASAELSRKKSTSGLADIIASTFANVDLRFTKAAMNEYSKRCEATSRENELLRNILEQQESDSIKVAQYLKEKLKSAEEDVAEQRREIQRLLAESADVEDGLRCQYERMLEKRDEQIAQYATTVQRLHSDLKATSQHVHNREMHRLELQQLHDEIEDMRTRHECEIAALRFQTVDRKMRLVALEETMREAFQAQVENESERLLEAKSKALIEDHEALQYERIRLTQDIEELAQLTTAKNMECANVRRKGELHQRACGEALRRIVLGNRRARESEVKTQRLERRVKELMQEKQVLREELTRQHEAQVQALEKTLAETRSSLQAHRVELMQLRRIASTVVRQRSDLERFFYVALEDVRRMRGKTSRKQQQQQGGGGATHLQLPSVSNVENSTSATGTSSVITNTNNTNNSSSRRIHNRQQQQQQQASLLTASMSSSPVAATTKGTTFLTESPTSVNATSTRTDTTIPVGSTATSSPGVHSSVVWPSPPSGEPLRRRGGDGSVKLVRDAATANISPNTNNVLNVDLGEDGEGAYLSELSWEDKEKIIKALLFFINQSCYQRLPGIHPSDDEAMTEAV